MTYDVLQNIDPWNNFLMLLTRHNSDVAESDTSNLRMLNAEVSSSKSEIYDRISDQTQQLGYDSYNPLINLGTISLFIGVIVIKVFILFAIIWPLSKCFPRMKMKFDSWKKRMFFGEFFRIIFEGYFTIVLCCFFNLSAPADNIDKNSINKWISICMLVVLVGFVPLALIYIAYLPTSVLADPKFKETWG